MPAATSDSKLFEQAYTHYFKKTMNLNTEKIIFDKVFQNRYDFIIQGYKSFRKKIECWKLVSNSVIEDERAIVEKSYFSFEVIQNLY
jgi:hypothetical protein